MNQSLILNDDLIYIDNKNSWLITGFYNGLMIKFYIAENIISKEVDVNQSLLFDIEAMIYEWLDKYDMEDDAIYITKP